MVKSLLIDIIAYFKAKEDFFICSRSKLRKQFRPDKVKHIVLIPNKLLKLVELILSGISNSDDTTDYFRFNSIM